MVYLVFLVSLFVWGFMGFLRTVTNVRIDIGPQVEGLAEGICACCALIMAIFGGWTRWHTNPPKP